MVRLSLALLALSALAACATTGDAANAQPAATAGGAQHQQQAAASGRGQRAGAANSQQQAQNRQQRSPRVDRQARAAVEREDLLTQMAFWAAEYTSFPNDLEAAQKFSEALRKGGRADRAASVAGEALQRFPADTKLLNTYGLSQIAAHKPQDALRPLALLAQAEPQNWQARSSLGVALDQLGRFPEARRAYQEALAIKADDPGILTNLGVSHLLAGEAAEAEAILRQAVALPNAPPQARQNLSIAVALQGRFDEAEQLARIDLPPAVVQQNMTYLRGLLTDTRRWGDLGRS